METNVLKMESFWQKHKKYAAEVYEIGTNVTGKQHGYGKYRFYNFQWKGEKKMVDILKGMDVSLCVFMAGIVAFVIAAILYLFLWETWSKAYEEDLEEETIEYYMIYTVWSKPESYGSRVILATADEAEARFRFHLIRTVSEIYFSGAAIAEHRDGIRISKGDAKLYYVMKTVQVENL